MIRFFSWIATVLVFTALAGAGAVLAVLYYFGRGLPDYEQLKSYDPPEVSRLYAGDGRLFAEYATQKRIFIPIEAIPKRVKETFLAAEDKNFYSHPGLDFMGIVRATFTNLAHMGSNKRPMGASTITQQVAKNLLLASISNQASYERKIKEAILAFRIENALSKDRILEIYLNEIFLGNRSYGVAAAAQNYFNKSLEELSIAEAAYLAALPKAPSRYHPKHHYDLAKNRRDWVITRMYEERIITLDEAKLAKQEPITLQEPDPKLVVHADFFAEEVRRQIVGQFGETPLYQGGLTIRTTLDPKLQKIADLALRSGLMNYDRRHGWRGPVAHLDLKETTAWNERLRSISRPAGSGPFSLAMVLKVNDKGAQIGFADESLGQISFEAMKWARKHLPHGAVGASPSKPSDVLAPGDVVLVAPLAEQENNYSLQQIPAVGGALLVMDPHTGRVLALSGGWSFENSQFNRATQAIRQPGSAIKPFVYLAAMERGFSPATIVSDSPVSISMGSGLGVYSPKNVTEHFYGSVPLRIGVQKSLNMMTVRLAHEYVGIKPIKKVIEKFRIMDEMPLQLAMVLGAGETTLLKMVTGYAMLANGGKDVRPSLVDRVQDRHGRTLFKTDVRPCPGCQGAWSSQEPPLITDTREQMADDRSVYQIITMLQGALRNGSAVKAQSLNRGDLAIKTGTTNEEKDAWTIGFTPDLVVGVYVGFDNPHPMGNKEGGSRVALPIWIEFMEAALNDVPEVPFKTPPGIKFVRMHEMTGRPGMPGESGVIMEALKDNQFLQGQGPSQGYETSYGSPYGSPYSPPYAPPSFGAPPPLAPAMASPLPPAPPPMPTSAGGLY